ncbi:Eco57I restriction-modification methylase domain-containing protein [Faunimonas sp. B44]|uniref:Eco57I restriction-modification methylase domain-containing protein n=1 Tax=Faunimonas sp. B44 TaxID=3461493 RepID=UPI0040440925
MDLFVAAGIPLSHAGGRGGKGGRPAPRSLRVPLFNYRVLQEALQRTTFDPSADQLAAAQDYARKARSARFLKQKETAVRDVFVEQVLGRVLGYRSYDPDHPFTLDRERSIRRGAVDVALGLFPDAEGIDRILAPFELKGPGARDLDAVPPGRGRSPVQQAWDYAIDAPGSRWVLVSNCLEVRLYAFGRGREAYESFDLTRLDEHDQHERLWLLLAADRFLGGATEKLLAETDSAYRTITDELYREYSQLRQRLIGFLINAADGPGLAPLSAIELAQKLLDRILFIAFAQRHDLLPERTLEKAAAERSTFVPQPVWRNFLALFRFIDEGEPRLYIHAYNGGLFAPDPIADDLILPDELAEDVSRLGQWDYRTDVPVTLLGHIFEQSITDLEKERAELTGQPTPVVSKRKREGVVYTPDIVTRFLVERTVGKTLEERFAARLATHAEDGALPENGDAIRWRDGEASERGFWRDYLATLRSLTIVDPACGSGAFLVAAFDLLAAEYRRVTERLLDLGEPVGFDPFDEIVTKNLYGVDLNAESVEITRLALWLKTARYKHRLQNLEATIKVGDSLIDDPAYTARPFDWRAAFPHVFADGGFDVAIGNPPYVRMEHLKPVKPYLEKNYVVAADRADLYAYFFERGVRILKPGGRLGYISSSTFFRTGSGENLRTFLGDGAAVETVVDFGDLQLFEGVTTYPAIVTLKKTDAPQSGDLLFLKVQETLPKDLTATFEKEARPMSRARLGTGSWRFEDEPLARLRDKITAGRPTLGEVYGPPLRGIVTGLNEAFVINTPTRDRLVAADPRSAELLKPFLRGEDIKRWRVEPEGLFLINTPKGLVDIERYPAIRDWLLPFRPELEKRATRQEWWELQQAQLAYQPKFETPKIAWPHFQDERSFASDFTGSYLNNKCFFLSAEDPYVSAVLNSTASWFQLASMARLKRGGYIEAEAQYVQEIAMPFHSAAPHASAAGLSESCATAAIQRSAQISAVQHRLRDLCPADRPFKLTRRLEHWWDLDFAGFRAEANRAFKADIPVRERGDWERFLAASGAEVRRLSAEIAAAEREIDRIVYGLFDLTADEIALLESSLAGQY